MKYKTLFLIFIISLIAVCSFAQNETVTITLVNQPAKSACENLFKSYNKNYDWNPPTLDGYVNISLKDVPFDTVLKRILSQINASFEYSNGIYIVRPDYSSATNQNMRGYGPTGMVGGPTASPYGPTGMISGGLVSPSIPGQAGAGIGTGMATGMGPTAMGPTAMAGGMGNRMGMFGQGTSKPKAFEDPIIKIRINYNSPNQILSLMDGEDYADVVYRTGGSGSSSSSSNNNSSSDSNNNSSSSRSSRSSSSSSSSSSSTSRSSNR